MTPQSTPTRIRVLIVDDHELFRSGVRSELSGDLDIVGSAGTVPEAIEAIRSLQPDVVLLDVHMPGGGGSAVIDAVRSELPAVRFLGSRSRMPPRTSSA